MPIQNIGRFSLLTVLFSKSDGEEADFDFKGSGLAAGLGRSVVVKRFLGVPALDVGAFGLACRNVAVYACGALMQLTPLHVGVGDLYFQSADSLVKTVGDEETLHAARCGLVETIKPDRRHYPPAEIDGIGSHRDGGGSGGVFRILSLCRGLRNGVLCPYLPRLHVGDGSGESNRCSKSRRQ